MPIEMTQKRMWRKFDFHVHTPASGEGYKESIITEEEFLKASMLAKLDCVAITDHNDAGWINSLKSKYEELSQLDNRPEWFRELAIFPGAEITISQGTGSIHLLAIFDVSTNADTITAVLGACGVNMQNTNPKDRIATKSFTNIRDTIILHGGIPIPAHIDSESGLLNGIKTLTPTLEQNLEKISAAEFCDRTIDTSFELSLKKKTDKLAKLGGSDAHELSQIGQHFSWVKMTTLSIENLKLALSSSEHCIINDSEDPNQPPSVWIEKLEIEKMKHCGRTPDQPFVVEFEYALNALIGGRGSGKSTVLESLRMGVGQDVLVDDKNNKLKTKRHLEQFKRDVILDETRISMHLWRNNSKYKLSYLHSNATRDLEKLNDSGDWRSQDIGNLQERFPVSVFSQKQIDDLAIDPQALLAIIDQSPNVKKDEWDEQWSNAKSKYIQLKERERELLRQVSNEPQLRVKLSDITNDLSQYDNKGHGDILSNYQRRTMQKNACPLNTTIIEFTEKLETLMSSITIPNFNMDLFNESDETLLELRRIYDDTSAEFRDIVNSLGQLKIKAECLNHNMSVKIMTSTWSASLNDVIEKYNNLIEEYSQKGNSLDFTVYDKWTQECRELQSKLNEIETKKGELEDIHEQVCLCKDNFHKLRNDLIERRRKFINDVIGSNKYVRMSLVSYGDVSSIEDDVRELLLIGNSFSSALLDSNDNAGLLSSLKNWQKNQTQENLPQLVAKIKEKILSLASGDTTYIDEFDKRFVSKLKGHNNDKPSLFDHLDTWFPEDLLNVEYSTGNSSSYKNITEGSHGEKSAAILAFLLSHGDQPLIIDQPEDDLDNALITDLIVNQIHHNKRKRQLIIATHNANIVVNGEAELVVALKFARGQVRIDKQGDLGDKDVKSSICTIMEGGKDAFKKRYECIGV